MADPLSAQQHFMQALQLIEGNSGHQRARMGHEYGLGKFVLVKDSEGAWLRVINIVICCVAILM